VAVFGHTGLPCPPHGRLLEVLVDIRLFITIKYQNNNNNKKIMHI